KPWVSYAKREQAPSCRACLQARQDSRGRQNQPRTSVAPTGAWCFSVRGSQGLLARLRLRSLHPGLTSLAPPRLKGQTEIFGINLKLLLRSRLFLNSHATEAICLGLREQAGNAALSTNALCTRKRTVIPATAWREWESTVASRRRLACVPR